MFNFYLDAYNHNERNIGNFKNDDGVVDTCAVSDGNQPYETGIKHFQYNKGEWVIVEAYSTIQEASVGHDKWVKMLVDGTLPNPLVDCNNAVIQQLYTDLFGNDPYVREDDGD